MVDWTFLRSCWRVVWHYFVTVDDAILRLNTVEMAMHIDYSYRNFASNSAIWIFSIHSVNVLFYCSITVMRTIIKLFILLYTYCKAHCRIWYEARHSVIISLKPCQIWYLKNAFKIIFVYSVFRTRIPKTNYYLFYVVNDIAFFLIVLWIWKYDHWL